MLKPLPLILIGAIALLSSCTLPIAQEQAQVAQTEIDPAATPFSNQDYETVLRTYVDSDGLVNYSALQENPQLLKNWIAQLGAVSPSTYASWNDSEKIAFLINAYNAITLESIIQQTPLKASIKDIFGVWNLKTHRVMGKSKTLDHIEHQILRKEFDEPRIHAALVCAAMSCPPLRQEPYTGEKLDQQLEDQVQQWLSGPHGLRIDRAANRVSISAIFKWFGEDWKNKYGVEEQFVGNANERAVLNFISQYVDAEAQTYLAQGTYKLDYLDYDWSLNRQSAPNTP